VIHKPDSGVEVASSIDTCPCWDCRNAAATVPQLMARATPVRAAKTTIVIRGSSPLQLLPCFCLGDVRRLHADETPGCEPLHTPMTFIIRSRAKKNT
jgi:hypothetical protein